MNRILAGAALLLLTGSAALAQATAPATGNPLRRPAPAATQPAAPPAPQAASPATEQAAAPKARRGKSAASGNFAERRTRCSGEWKAAKAANKTNGQKWPAFWSACNTRLKAAGV